MISIFCDELFVCSIRAVRIRVPYILRSRSSLLGDDTRTMVANSGSTDTTLSHVERPKWRFVSKRLPRRRQLLPQTTVNSLVPYTTNSKGSSSRCKDGTVGRGTISTENNISATFFFFAAHETDNLCTCCSGNVFPHRPLCSLYDHIESNGGYRGWTTFNILEISIIFVTVHSHLVTRRSWT